MHMSAACVNNLSMFAAYDRCHWNRRKCLNTDNVIHTHSNVGYSMADGNQ